MRDDAVVLLFVGRLQPLKAPDLLLRAAAQLLRDDPALRERLVVAIVGGPSGSGLSPPRDRWRSSRRARHRRRRPISAAGSAGRRWSSGTAQPNVTVVPVVQRVLRPGGRRVAGMRNTGRCGCRRWPDDGCPRWRVRRTRRGTRPGGVRAGPAPLRRPIRDSSRWTRRRAPACAVFRLVGRCCQDDRRVRGRHAGAA